MKIYLKFYVFLLAAVAFFMTSVASAAVPAGLDVGTLQSDVTTITDSVIPIVVSVFTIMVLIRVFKRSGNKI